MSITLVSLNGAIITLLTIVQEDLDFKSL